MLIEQIFYGLLITAAGILALKYNYQLVGFTGRQFWIESKLGQGSTYLVYKLVALLMVFGGITWASGTADFFFGPIVDAIAGLFNFQPAK